MTMKKLLPVWFLPVLLLSHMSQAQDKDKWDLRRCVEYAIANNISVKQSDVQARLSKLTFDQSKLSQIPTLGVGAGAGINSGRSQNPNSFTLSTVTYLYNNYSLQSSVSLFNFFSLRNSIEANRYAFQAALATTDRVKNDISLNVANAYLQVLLSTEQAEAARLQLKLSQNQLEITHKQVNAGTLPELNAAELEAQVAQDSSNYITTQGAIIQNTLTLKAYMGMDAGARFEVDTPPVDQIPIEQLANLQPEAVYALALAYQPLQKADAYLVESAQKSVASNKGAMYPNITLSGSLSSSYVNLTSSAPVYSPFFTDTTVLRVAGSTNKIVNDQAQILTGFTKVKANPYFDQLNRNFSQNLGLNISIPILNGGTQRTNYSRSKLNLRNYELQRDQDNLTLKQNIYQAYTASITALQKFEANKISVAATQKSFEYAQKRYGIGMLNTIDLLTNQNNFFKAKIDLLYSQFDYVFKMKVLEFYKGLGIKLTK
ncbi:MAG TPA: TolC family protein [Puia sp.]|nr:TolC family protein [Puia sp.]